MTEQTRKLMQDLADHSERSRRVCREIRRQGMLDSKRFPIEAAGTLIAIGIPMSANEWLKLNHTKFWLGNPWIVLATIAAMIVGICIAIRVPKWIIRDHKKGRAR